MQNRSQHKPEDQHIITSANSTQDQPGSTHQTLFDIAFRSILITLSKLYYNFYYQCDQYTKVFQCDRSAFIYYTNSLTNISKWFLSSKSWRITAKISCSFEACYKVMDQIFFFATKIIGWLVIRTRPCFSTLEFNVLFSLQILIYT